MVQSHALRVRALAEEVVQDRHREEGAALREEGAALRDEEAACLLVVAACPLVAGALVAAEVPERESVPVVRVDPPQFHV